MNHETLRVCYIAGMSIAAAMAAPGWVLPLRDGAGRYTWRYLALGAYCAAWMCFAADAVNGWPVRAAGFALGVIGAHFAGCCWRQAEAARKADDAAKRRRIERGMFQ